MDGRRRLRMRRIGFALVVVAALGWFALLRRWHNDAVASISPEDRSAIVERGVATLRAACRPPVLLEREALCRAQAEVIAGMPECSTECRAVIATILHRPTR